MGRGQSRQGIAAAVLAAAVLAGTGTRARGAEPAPAPTPQQMQQMMDQIHALQAKVEALQAAQQASQAAATHPSTQPSGVATAGPSAEQTAAATSAVEQDATDHSQLFDLSNPLTGGWNGNGFILRSENGDFSFHPGLLVGARNMTSWRYKIAPGGGGTDTPKASGYDLQNGFDLTRVRVTFDGNLFKQVTYFVQIQADQGSPLGLLDAYGIYHFGDSPFGFKFGQFKDPVFHERNLNEGVLMAVDRTEVESLLGGGQTSRVQGAGVTYANNDFRAQALITDGFDSINTHFNDAGGIGAGIGGGAGVTPTDFGTSGRAEYMLIGDHSNGRHPYSEYDQFSALGDTQDILVLGAGADYSQAGSNSVIFHSADLQYDTTKGLSAYVAYLGTSRDLHANQGIARPGIYYDAGFVVQAAYVIQNRFEPFARFDFTHLAPHSITGLDSDNTQELTVGANYYLYGQHVKITTDATWLPNGAPADNDALGILKDTGHTEWLLRAQFQIWL